MVGHDFTLCILLSLAFSLLLNVQYLYETEEPNEIKSLLMATSQLLFFNPAGASRGSKRQKTKKVVTKQNE